jgi:hypothetical protein
MNCKTETRYVLAGTAMALILSGCASRQVKIPETRTNYRVSANGQEFDDVETVEIRGGWVLLDGRRLIPKEKIDYIRADREKPGKK